MSSDYYGSIAGEIADQGAQDEAAFLEWLNEYTRHEATGTYHDDLRAAFGAGMAHAPEGAVKLLTEALHLRMNGERAPGGNETWRDWERDAETFLRARLDAAAAGSDENARG